MSFATTHWSIVLEAGRGRHAEADVALAELCQKYWFPLYAYVRRRVHDTAEAQDLTQEFFARLLEKELLAQATPDRGRFRSFLLTAMQNFLTNEWRKAQATKRGGGQRILSLDFSAGDSRLNFEPGYDWTAERIFERNWSITLLEHVLTRLRDEYTTAGKEQLFAALRPYISNNRDEGSFAAVAEKLEMTMRRLRGCLTRWVRSTLAIG